jgi:hypothetical protein
VGWQIVCDIQLIQILSPGKEKVCFEFSSQILPQALMTRVREGREGEKNACFVSESKNNFLPNRERKFDKG